MLRSQLVHILGSSVSIKLRPMPLVRIPEAVDHTDWLFELKHDGFRAIADGLLQEDGVRPR